MTGARASRATWQSGSLIPFSRRSLGDSAWDSPSADRSSNRTGGGYGSALGRRAVPRSASRCLEPGMTESASMIYVVDDDASVREAVYNLLASAGHTAAVFESTEAFLAGARAEVPSCLVLDVRLPRIGGLEFQDQLARLGIR